MAGGIPSVDRVLTVIPARVLLLSLGQDTDKPASGRGRVVLKEWQPDRSGP